MIETTRLLLRPMHEDDMDDLLAILADPRVMAAFGVAPFDRAQMERWVQRNLGHQAAHGYGLFSVILKENNILIGDCGLERMEIAGRHEAELGYDFRSDYWNRGFATEAATAVRDYAFQTLALPRLVSMIRQGNHASRRVAEKIGMRLDAEVMRYGQPYWVYALSRDELAQPP
jgi:RimJ/RimL family protein N-acetyltransferase